MHALLRVSRAYNTSTVHRLQPVLKNMLKYIQWELIPDNEYPLKTKVNNELVKIRVNSNTSENSLLTAVDEYGKQIMHIEHLSDYDEWKMNLEESKKDTNFIFVLPSIEETPNPYPHHRLALVLNRLLKKINWEGTGDFDYPLKAKVNNELVILRSNDWPAEPLLTALDKDGNEIMDIEYLSDFWEALKEIP